MDKGKGCVAGKNRSDFTVAVPLAQLQADVVPWNKAAGRIIFFSYLIGGATVSSQPTKASGNARDPPGKMNGWSGRVVFWP